MSSKTPLIKRGEIRKQGKTLEITTLTDSGQTG